MQFKVVFLISICILRQNWPAKIYRKFLYINSLEGVDYSLYYVNFVSAVDFSPKLLTSLNGTHVFLAESKAVEK